MPFGVRGGSEVGSPYQDMPTVEVGGAETGVRAASCAMLRKLKFQLLIAPTYYRADKSWNFTALLGECSFTLVGR
jgi:hypothetical protein